MGDAFIVRRGGGTPYAFIRVIFPVGSACSITDGTRTINAPADAVTLGRYTFPIPGNGNWVATCTDGTHTKSSSSMSITAKYQYYATTLAYEYVLFENGQTAVSFESLHRDTTSITVGTNITFKGYAPSYSGAAYRTMNTVSRQSYTKLCIKGTVSRTGIYLSYGDKLDQFAVGNENDSSLSLATSSSERTYQLDISSFSTAKYVNVTGRGDGVFSKIWLE